MILVIKKEVIEEKGCILTWGIRKSLRRLATWMDVTELAAPTTPLMTLRTVVLLQLNSAPSILLIDPEIKWKILLNYKLW